MIPETNFQSRTPPPLPAPKKVYHANLPPGKIYLEIETPGKNHNQRTLRFLRP